MMLFFVAIIAICGILYELLIWTLSSYLIWNSVQQFSFVIGFFMSWMWIWAYFSRFLEKNNLKNFFLIELILSIVWASSVILLKFSYIYFVNYSFSFQIIYFLITLSIWTFVWMEIPLVASIYKKLNLSSKSIVSDIFTFDYIWWLIASLIFPLFLLPVLWLYNISIFVWSINLFVAICYLFYLKKKGITEISFKKYFTFIFLVICYFVSLLFLNIKIENIYLQHFYKEPILQTFESPYQQIVLTKRWDDFRMYLNWNLQFLSLDERIYHEALIDRPLWNIPNREISALVLGGWDWLAVRNLLKNPNVSSITLVDLDPKVLEIAKTEENLLALNEWSLLNPKVKIYTQDAFQFIINTKEKFDFIVADFPDPRDTSIAKLYSKEFYTWVLWTLKEHWVFVTQASNAFFSNKVLFSTEKTISSVFWSALAYHRYLPSFWDWWFVVAKKNWTIDKKALCWESNCFHFEKVYLEWTQNLSINTLAEPRMIDYYWEWYKKYNL